MLTKKEIIEQLKQLEEIKVSWQSFSDRFFCLKDTVLTKAVRDQFLLNVDKPELGSFNLDITVDVTMRFFAHKYNKSAFTIEFYTEVLSCSGASDSSITGLLIKHFSSFEEAVNTYKVILVKPTYKEALEYCKDSEFSDRYGNKKSTQPSMLEYFGGSLY